MVLFAAVSDPGSRDVSHQDALYDAAAEIKHSYSKVVSQRKQW